MEMALSTTALVRMVFISLSVNPAAGSSVVVLLLIVYY
jgi:hypothetical protein